MTAGRPVCVRWQGLALLVSNVWRGRVRKLLRAQKEKVSLSENSGETNYVIPPHPCPLGDGAELVCHFRLCLNFHQVRCAAYLLRIAGLLFQQDAGIQLNLAPSRKEVTHRNKTKRRHPVTFQNKTLRVDSTLMSKRDKHKLF